MFTVAIKSGTSNHSDFDNCDWVIATIPSTNIPKKGETLEFGNEENAERKRYLVTDVKRTYNHEKGSHPFEEWIRVYVIVI